MEKSEQINELMTALNKAQKAFKDVHLDCNNTFLKAKYASLSSIKEAYHEALTANGLSVVQMIEGGIEGHTLRTILAHISGQWLASSFPLIVNGKEDMQALGAAITYARRYSIPAILGLVDSEDDSMMAVTKARTSELSSKMVDETKEKLKNFAPQQTKLPEKKLPPTEVNTSDLFMPGDFKVTFGKYKGQTLKEMGKPSVQAMVDWIEKDTKAPRAKSLDQCLDYAKMYLNG